MTEAEWLACDQPTSMLNQVRAAANDRKLRLFAVGCCRLFESELNNAIVRDAVETNERFADGAAAEGALGKARSAAHSNAWSARYETVMDPIAPGVFTMRSVQREDVSEEHQRRLYFIAFMANLPSRLRADAMPMLQDDPVLRRHTPNLIRCVFRNSFRPVAVDPAWLTPTVVALATGIYADRAFDRMPVLADALEEAGCDNADVLVHCREPGEHVRGCWVVDLLLGRE